MRQATGSRAIIQDVKKQPTEKVLGRIFPGHQGPRCWDIPDKKLYASGLFLFFRHGVAAMSRDLGRDVPDLEKLYARILWADVSFHIIKG